MHAYESLMNYEFFNKKPLAYEGTESGIMSKTSVCNTGNGQIVSKGETKTKAAYLSTFVVRRKFDLTFDFLPQMKNEPHPHDVVLGLKDPKKLGLITNLEEST